MRKFWVSAILIVSMGLAFMFVVGCDIGEIIGDDIRDELFGDEGDGNGDEDVPGGDGEYDPDIDPEDFVGEIDNPYFPLTPGTTFVYEGESEDGEERIEVNVTHDTKQILGVTCIVVRDRVWVDENEDEVWRDEELVEETFDWYAQDDEGNVWYMGEDSKEYEAGVVVSTEGSWEAGVDGAKPGVVMWAQPEIGVPYRQEYYAGEAEDMAEVLSLNESITVPYGSFGNCLQTKEWTPLAPDVVEHKFYASGVGVILEVMVEGGTDRVELVEVIQP